MNPNYMVAKFKCINLANFWPKMAILTVLTQSQRKSDQFEVFKGYIDALNPNFIDEKLQGVSLASYGYFGSFDAVTE